MILQVVNLLPPSKRTYPWKSRPYNEGLLTIGFTLNKALLLNTYSD